MIISFGIVIVALNGRHWGSSALNLFMKWWSFLSFLKCCWLSRNRTKQCYTEMEQLALSFFTFDSINTREGMKRGSLTKGRYIWNAVFYYVLKFIPRPNFYGVLSLYDKMKLVSIHKNRVKKRKKANLSFAQFLCNHHLFGHFTLTLWRKRTLSSVYFNPFLPIIPYLLLYVLFDSILHAAVQKRNWSSFQDRREEEGVKLKEDFTSHCFNRSRDQSHK